MKGLGPGPTDSQVKASWANELVSGIASSRKSRKAVHFTFELDQRQCKFKQVGGQTKRKLKLRRLASAFGLGFRIEWDYLGKRNQL